MEIPCDPNCPKRSQTCHGECFEFALYSAINEIKREQRYKEKQKTAGVYDYQAKWTDRKQKKKQKKLFR